MNVNAKKLKRLESKKKKAAAFLNLVRQASTDPVIKPVSNNPAEEMATTSVEMATAPVEMKKFECTSTEVKPESTEMKPENTQEDVLLEMQRIVRERKKFALTKPNLFLTLEDMVPYHPVDVPISPDIIPPLYVMDLQQLLLYGIQGNMCSFKPRWCKLARPGKVSSVVVVLIDGLGYSDYTDNKECFPYITETFKTTCEMVCPQQYNRTVFNELHSVPLSVSQLKKANVKVPTHIKEQVAEKMAKNSSGRKQVEKANKEANKDQEKVEKTNFLKNECISRKCLLLSTHQMMREGYPLPIVTVDGNFNDFVFSKAKYKEVSDTSPLWAVDCEMCMTTLGKNELTRVSIVNEEGECIYDKLVKPYRRITNYLTKYSGITKQMLDPINYRIEDVQRDFRELLPADVILCGQSLNSDLLALKLFHPYVIDTSVIYNMSGQKGVKAGLRKLTQFFLGRAIQGSADGHCSHEDALAALDLVKLKLTKGLEFGDATLSGIYFPDINTYFLGEETADKKTENVESDSKAKSAQLNNGGDAEHKEKERLEKSKEAAVTNGDSSETSEEDDKKDLEENDEPPRKKVKKENSVTQAEFFKSTSTILEQQTELLFSQKNSVHISHSFFRLVHEAGRSGCVIDYDAVTSKLMKEPIDIITVENDSEARRTAKREIKSKEFVWVKLRGIAEDESEESNHNKLMKKIDKRVKSVLKHAKSHSLVVVLMTGRKSESELQNMRTFMTITT